MDYIKIFGIQRTGTTYLANIILRNFCDVDVLTHEFGWKHGPINIDMPEWFDLFKDDPRSALARKALESNVYCIVIIKNPYTWYTSILNWLVDNKHDFIVEDDTPEKIFIKYNDLYRGHLPFINGTNNEIYKKIILVRYEDLLIDPLKVLLDISEAFNIVFGNDEVVFPKNVRCTEKFEKESRLYYINQAPIYPLDTVQRVTASIDWGTITQYGYTPIK
jgi:hypothetical protein